MPLLSTGVDLRRSRMDLCNVLIRLSLERLPGSTPTSYSRPANPPVEGSCDPAVILFPC
ncbi:MAG: hypothetical protein LBJ36_03080 [Synergistaceae bacterium]|nr:hypothetical protein [Synergistaceae bacterium]